MPAILVPRRLRQRNGEIKPSTGYTVRLSQGKEGEKGGRKGRNGRKEAKKMGLGLVSSTPKCIHGHPRDKQVSTMVLQVPKTSSE